MQEVNKDLTYLYIDHINIKYLNIYKDKKFYLLGLGICTIKNPSSFDY